MEVGAELIVFLNCFFFYCGDKSICEMKVLLWEMWVVAMGHEDRLS